MCGSAHERPHLRPWLHFEDVTPLDEEGLDLLLAQRAASGVQGQQGGRGRGQVQQSADGRPGATWAHRRRTWADRIAQAVTTTYLKWLDLIPVSHLPDRRHMLQRCAQGRQHARGLCTSRLKKRLMSCFLPSYGSHFVGQQGRRHKTTAKRNVGSGPDASLSRATTPEMSASSRFKSSSRQLIPGLATQHTAWEPLRSRGVGPYLWR